MITTIAQPALPRPGRHRRSPRLNSHDLGVLAELEAAGLIVLADKGYQGATHAKFPYRGKNKPESQKTANRAHATALNFQDSCSYMSGSVACVVSWSRCCLRGIACPECNKAPGMT